MQAQLGHANINTTLGVYTHVTPALCDAVSDALAGTYQALLSDAAAR